MCGSKRIVRKEVLVADHSPRGSRVLAEVCLDCGERYYDLPTMNQLFATDKKSKAVRNPSHSKRSSRFDEESISLSSNPEFLAMLRRSRESLKKTGAIPLEEIKRKYGLADSPKASRKNILAGKAKRRKT